MTMMMMTRMRMRKRRMVETRRKRTEKRGLNLWSQSYNVT
jgi:hypothetical protein